MKFAFYGRVSTEDAQDPSLSLPRQLAACERIVRQAGGEIVACYWDIESGRKELGKRGTGADGDAFAVQLPRDGGLPQLLQAALTGRSFDAVIVESIDRLSRMTADATRIERDLEQRDIALFASDEPMTANATAILTRRVKQGVAEWYVRDLIEKSRRGMEESVRQGWHTGGLAPYGYQLGPHDHPNPQKAREGRKKHRLITDPVTAPIVSMIFEDYCLHGLGLGAISDKLNADLDRYPPPTRNKKDENDLPQTWSRSQLQAMLRNPKYTGFNVWGRHDKRPGRPFIRPRDQWVWSPAPSHEAIVSRELFDQVEERALRNHRGATLRAPKTYVQRSGRRNGRLYALRGRIHCRLCGRRMEGSHQKGSNWYRCQFVYRRGIAAADAAGHPRVLGIREEVVLEPLFDFLGRRLFGPDRLHLLRHELATALVRRRRQPHGGAHRSHPAARRNRPGHSSAGAPPGRARRSRPSCRRRREGPNRGTRRPARRTRRAAPPARGTSQQRTATAGDRSAARIDPRPPPRTRPLRARRARGPLRRVRRHGHLRQAEPLARARRHHHRRPRTGPRKTATASSAVAEFRYSGGRI